MFQRLLSRPPVPKKEPKSSRGCWKIPSFKFPQIGKENSPTNDLGNKVPGGLSEQYSLRIQSSFF